MADIAAQLGTIEVKNFENKSFIPFDELNRLFTRDTVYKLLRQHDIEFHLIDEILDRVCAGGIRTFAILGAIEGIGNITRFIKGDQFSGGALDARLPLKDTDISQYFSNSDKGKLFLRKQWSFLAPIFSESQSCGELDDRIILPFLQAECFSNNGFSGIYRITVEASHYISNTSVKRLDLIWSQTARRYSYEVSILSTLRSLQHPSIMPLTTAFSKGEFHSFLCPVAEGNLSMLLDTEYRLPGFQTETEIFGSLWGVSSALDAIHNYRFSHLKIQQVGCLYDIRPRNILFSDGRLLLSGFGFSSPLEAADGPQTTFRAGGSTLYSAPEHESIEDGFERRRVGRASDVWSFGCVLAEILAYISVEPAEGPAAVKRFREDRRVVFESFYTTWTFYGDKEINPGVQRLLEHCKQKSSDGLRLLTRIVDKILQFDPDQRPSAADVTRLLYHLAQQTRVSAIISTFSKDVEPLDIELEVEMRRLEIWSETVGLNADLFDVARSTWLAANHHFDDYTNLQLLLVNIQNEISVIATELQKMSSSQPTFGLYYRLQQLQDQLWDGQPPAVRRTMLSRLEEEMLSKDNPARSYETLELVKGTLSDKLANFYKNQGNLAEAETMYQRALDKYENALGLEHEMTLSAVNNLGNLYADKGKLTDAEKMYQRALDRFEKALGPEHTSTIDIINHLRTLYVSQGLYAAAKEIGNRPWRNAASPSELIYRDSIESDLSETSSTTSLAWSDSSKSSASSYASSAIEAALDMTTELFWSDEEFRGLFAEAFVRQDRDMVLRKGARLLNWLGRRLVVAAKKPVEKDAAKLFLSRRHDQSIVDRIALKVLENPSEKRRQGQTAQPQLQSSINQERLETYLQQRTIMPSIDDEPKGNRALKNASNSDSLVPSDEIPNDVESEASIDSGDEQQFTGGMENLNIYAVKSFLKSSDAFARFKEELGDFVSPFRNESMWKKRVWIGEQQISFELQETVPQRTNIYKLKLRLEETLRMPIQWWPLKQPRKHLSPNKVRMVLPCECGFETHVDISQAKARRYRQMCSTYPMRSTPSQHPILPTTNASSSSWSAVSQAQASLSASQQGLARNLQQRPTRDRSALPQSQDLELNATAVAQNNAAPEYIQWCVDVAPQRTLLHEICKEEKKGRDFINELFRSYRKIRGWKWYFSMTTCAEIKFVNHTRIYPKKLVVKCGYEKRDVLPKLDERHQYTYKPFAEILDEEDHVCLAEQALIHYYHGYESCHATDHFSKIVDSIPYYLNGAELGRRGYGIWARQGWTLPKLAAFALITQGWAMVFVVCWLYYHPGDLQNAFVPALYWLGLITIFVMVPDVFRT